jgi:hypothetical protein
MASITRSSPQVSSFMPLDMPGEADEADTEQNYHSNEVIKPLSERPLEEWWAHGMLTYPPAPGNFLELPAGGSLIGQ